MSLKSLKSEYQLSVSSAFSTIASYDLYGTNKLCNSTETCAKEQCSTSKAEGTRNYLYKGTDYLVERMSFWIKQSTPLDLSWVCVHDPGSSFYIIISDFILWVFK